jgi:YYY domain-containing protein
MIWSVFVWYLVAVGIGLLVFPLAYRLFPNLNDRGYSVSRALGLLLWGYLFWLLSSYGLLPNTVGGYLLALALLFGLVTWALRKYALTEIAAWLKEKEGYLLAVELVFLIGYAFMILMRGMEPELLTTEKPMELAFINAILRSPSMPPLDPWLADYSISYYYFGYVIVAMLAKFTGVTAGMAFNLAISLVFAMAAVGGYGIVYNLLAVFSKEKPAGRAFQALRGPVFVLLLSNLEGFLEYLHARGVFWTQTADGVWQSKFWRWLDILDLSSPPTASAEGDLRYWWWWRASRVIHDTDILGNHREVINEFPFFSYFLADLHPHVLTMPFVFLVLALTLNLFLDRGAPEHPFRIWMPGFNFQTGPFVEFRSVEFGFSFQTFIFSSVILGGIAFLNIWDWPWYVGLFAAAYVLRQAGESGWQWGRLWEFLGLGLLLGVAGVLAYLPFFLSFSSQAGGFMVNLINPTRGAQLWVMFGTLFLPLVGFLLYLLRRKGDRRSLFGGFGLSIGITLLLFLVSLVPLLAAGWLAHSDSPRAYLGLEFFNQYAGVSFQELLDVSLARRGAAIAGLLSMVVLIGLAAAALWPRRNEETQEKAKIPKSHLFAGLLILFGGALVLIPEFVFLVDLFSHRMNTIFKFYYQAWLLWGVAAAYGSGVLLHKIDLKSTLYGLVLAVVVTMGLVYPLMGIHTRISSFLDRTDRQFNLDGTVGSHYYFLSADEKQAVLWLQQAPLGTLVEAVGGSYSNYARISANSGQPALLGWPGHEDQWRGSRELFAARQDDIFRLYTTQSWVEAENLIQKYGITYIVVSTLERTTYNVRINDVQYLLNEDKFARFLTPVFQSGSITIYQTSITAP